jgi:transcriptional regulator with XRE-family HTH domain
LTQAQVAQAVDAKQSAVSMFENGKQDALSRDKLAAIVKLLDVDTAGADADRRGDTGPLRYCPDPDCPANIPYLIGSRVALQPAMVQESGDGPAYCRFCGEVLASSCPNRQCQHVPAPGAFCAACGTAYVEATAVPSPAESWVRSRQQSTRELFDMTETVADSPAMRRRT